MNDTLDQKLATLKLGRMRQVYPSWVEQAAQSELGYAEFLDQLVTEELLARKAQPTATQNEGSRLSLRGDD